MSALPASGSRGQKGEGEVGFRGLLQAALTPKNVHQADTIFRELTSSRAPLGFLPYTCWNSTKLVEVDVSCTVWLGVPQVPQTSAGSPTILWSYNPTPLQYLSAFRQDWALSTLTRTAVLYERRLSLSLTPFVSHKFDICSALCTCMVVIFHFTSAVQDMAQILPHLGARLLCHKGHPATHNANYRASQEKLWEILNFKRPSGQGLHWPLRILQLSGQDDSRGWWINLCWRRSTMKSGKSRAFVGLRCTRTQLALSPSRTLGTTTTVHPHPREFRDLLHSFLPLHCSAQDPCTNKSRISQKDFSFRRLWQKP